MIHNAYSLLDTKSGLYSQPFYTNHHAMAFRICADVSRDVQSTPSKYPDDFVLYYIGYYNDATAELGSVPHQNLGSISAIVAAISGSTPTE